MLQSNNTVSIDCEENQGQFRVVLSFKTDKFNVSCPIHVFIFLFQEIC